MRPRIVTFSAAWCAPCKLLKPTLAVLEKEYPKIDWLTLDVDQQPREAQFSKVQSVPVVVFYKEGVEVGRLNGNIHPRQFRDAINLHFNLP